MIKPTDLHDVDVLIVGGGLIGATLALALANTNYRVLVVERNHIGCKARENKTAPDGRTLALSMASINILQQLQLWSSLQARACPIQAIHVSQEGYWGSTRLSAKEQEQEHEPFGYVVSFQAMVETLYAALKPETIKSPASFVSMDNKARIANIAVDDKTYPISFKLLIAADGGESKIRQWTNLEAERTHYKQCALTANVELARNHHHDAFERFTAEGSLAFLPVSEKQVALVWCLPEHEAQAMQHIPDASFIATLQKKFGYRLGRFLSVTPRELFPLQEMIMPKQAEWPILFIGNAAHMLHPVAAQGFNLGLRDVATLAECITDFGINQTMLKQYERMRQHDQRAIIHFTESLIRIFGVSWTGFGLLRSLGLMTLDNSEWLQHIILRYTKGFGGVVPRLACKKM